MSRTPLVIIGFDSGDPRFLQEWAKEGKLPTLASLMERGCWAETSSPELTLEHGAWVSIFSGVSRSHHGFYYFRQLIPGSYDLQLTYGAELKVAPFWASGLGADKRVIVADGPEIALIPALPGAQLANWAVHRGYISRAIAHQPRSEPAPLLGEITRKFGPPVEIIESPEANENQNRQIYRDLLARVAKKGELCRFLIAREQPDLVVCCFGESHTAGHQFWSYRQGSHQPAPNGEFSHAIRDVYQAIDHQMGLLLSQMPESSNVVVLSSLGLTDHYPTGGLMESFCRELGYQATPESSQIKLRPAAVARRMLPESWRIALSRNLSREARERLFAQQFRAGSDWQRTTAFAIPSIYTGFLRVNLRGREPQGIVDPGAHYQNILQQLETDLHQLIDPQTGQTAIEKVVRVGEFYEGKPPDVLPDLIVQWKSSTHFLDRVTHPKAELTQKKPEFFRNSEHTDRGFFAAAGPAIQDRGKVADIEVLDLAPTFLSLLDEPKGKQMAGNTIPDLLKPNLEGHVS